MNLMSPLPFQNNTIHDIIYNNCALLWTQIQQIVFIYRVILEWKGEEQNDAENVVPK